MLTEELTQLAWKVLPSGANFIFAEPPGPAEELYQRLVERHVLVRHFSRPSVRQGLRISIGTQAQCRDLLHALRA